MASVVEETLRRLQSHKGVEGVLIVDGDGHTIKSTLDEEQTEQHASLLSQVRPFPSFSILYKTIDEVSCTYVLRRRRGKFYYSLSLSLSLSLGLFIFRAPDRPMALLRI